MEKATRNLIERATQGARRLLEREFGQQLEGDYDILPDGRIPPEPGAHLDARGRLLRAKLVAAVEHRRAGGLSPKDAVDATIREAAFTTLNRFVALKGLEARGMVQECITKGENSAGFREFGGLAPGLVALPDKGYRLYLESLFDEIGREVRVLFDRSDVAGLLWPRHAALGELLDLLNDTALAEVWGQDETIGWVYQYFNGEDERRKMREASQAPRNSRELAVRNQFFTPRYVVEFLTDNTLGRTWYEMRQGETRLRDDCRYLVRRPDEVFLIDPAINGEAGRDPDATFLRGESADLAPFAVPGGAWDDRPGAFPHYDGDAAFDRLVRFAHRVRPFGWSDDPRLPGWRELLGRLATGAPDEPVVDGGKTQDLWDCLLAIARAERFGDGQIAAHATALTRIANEIRRRLLDARQPDASQEELLRAPVLIAHRAKKDPRDLTILDPACGSGHFLLYCFDLLLTIYEEGWSDEYAPPSATTGATLRDDYPALDDLCAALPGLVLRHNLHGIDIDPRAAQIAELALWMRAQRAYNDFGLARGARPPIRKNNIVVAEPMPGERAILDDFLRGVDPRLHRLVYKVWDGMNLAGEAGSLLRIEREITDEIALVRRERTGDTAPLRLSSSRGGSAVVQSALAAPSDAEGIFWDRAEETLLTALREFTTQATGGAAMGRRLFAENAAHGFAFVDLCRKKFDVVLMNPPFGEFSLPSRDLAAISYPSCGGEIYAAFVLRATLWITRSGLIGAITSRNGFSISSLRKWREECVVPAGLPILAELGEGVLDTAMVETAAYVLGGQESDAKSSVFVRLPSKDDRQNHLLYTSEELSKVETSSIVVLNSSIFRAIPGTPFAYWIAPALMKAFRHHKQLEGNAATIRVGLQTGDDFRFVRAFWEVAPDHITTSGVPPYGWVPHAKGGANLPFFADIHLVVKWHGDGHEVKSHHSSYPRNADYYFRLGLTFPYRTFRLSPAVLPIGCIPGVTGMGIYPMTVSPSSLLTLLNSGIVNQFVSIWLGGLDSSSLYQAGTIQHVPIPRLPEDVSVYLDIIAEEQVRISISRELWDETSRYFTTILALPSGTIAGMAQQTADDHTSLKRERLRLFEWAEKVVASLFGLNQHDHSTILIEAKSRMERTTPSNELDMVQAAITQVSFALGCVLGRWDVQPSTNSVSPLPLPDPFAPLPVCSPGMLTGDDGLPAREVPPGYPLAISWDGILVDDPGHPQDVIGRIREVLEVIWGERADDIYEEAAQILAGGGHDLRPWFRVNFFEEHIKRYSKSRRRAPIYWRLATPSGSYALWLYYHRFSRDTLYKALNDYVDPKVRHEERRLDALRTEAAENPTAGQRRAIEAQEAFVEELRAFRDEIARVAPLWNPDLNDGVIINFAPLWRLTPRPRAWQKECRDTWEALVAGKYDWAHLAMHLWPERVVPKCREDRSVAIAHGLDHQLWIEGHDGKWQPRHVSDATMEALIAERGSPAVYDAVARLLDAPAEAPPPRRAAARQGRQATGGQRSRKGRDATQLPLE